MTLGVVLIIWGVVNLAASLLAVISFALMQAEVYDRSVSRSITRRPSASPSDRDTFASQGHWHRRCS